MVTDGILCCMVSEERKRGISNDYQVWFCVFKKILVKGAIYEIVNAIGFILPLIASNSHNRSFLDGLLCGAFRYLANLLKLRVLVCATPLLVVSIKQWCVDILKAQFISAFYWDLPYHIVSCPLWLYRAITTYKKVIRRWDSERELSLRQHRTRTAKYNRLVHKFRHRSTRLCVGTHVYQIQWNRNITAITPFKIIQVNRFWYQSKAHIWLPISD